MKLNIQSQVDAQTFADWNIDYLKIDGCNLDPELLEISMCPLITQHKLDRPIAKF